MRARGKPGWKKERKRRRERKERLSSSENRLPMTTIVYRIEAGAQGDDEKGAER